MAVVFPHKDTSGTAGIADSLGKTLNMLTQNKMMQQQQAAMMQQQDAMRQQETQRIAGALQQTLGIDPEEAQAIASLPPEQQKMVFERLLGGGEEAQDPSMGGAPGQEAQPPPDGAPSPMDALESLVEGIEEDSPGYQDASDKVKEAVSKMSPEDRQLVKQYMSDAEKPKKKTMRQRLAAQKKVGVDYKEELARKKFALAEKKFEVEKQQIADSETKEFYSTVMKEGKAARDGDMRLGQMEELNEHGKLNSSSTFAALTTLEHGLWGVGINLKSLMSTDSQVFEKLTMDFLKGAKAVFGSRVTQTEIELYLKTVPSLMQTKEGRRRVINNLKIFNEGAKLRKKTMSKIIEENYGERPKGLEMMVDKRVGGKLDKLTEKFIGKEKRIVRAKATVIAKKKQRESARRRKVRAEKNKKTFLGIPW